MYKSRRQTESERIEARRLRLARGYPAHQPPHPIQHNIRYLITAACFEHRHHLRNSLRRDLLLTELFKECANHEVTLLAWSILTNHYHLLVHVAELKQLGYALRKVHGRTSFTWNGEDECRGRKVWYQYADRAIRSERHFWTSMNYIHFNPVKHGLAASPLDWTHSSVHDYRKLFGLEWLRGIWRKYPTRASRGTWE